MRRIASATPENGQAIAIAVERLREARKLLRAAAAGHAISSAEGAARHVEHRIRRTRT